MLFIGNGLVRRRNFGSWLGSTTACRPCRIEVSIRKLERSSVSKRIVLSLSAVVVSLSLLAWLISRIDLTVAGSLLSNARWGYLSVALIGTCALPLVVAVRWYSVLTSQPQETPPFRVALKGSLLANTLNSVLPSKSGDLAKAAYLRNHGGFAYGVGTVLLERVVDLGILGLFALVGGLYCGETVSTIAGVGLLCAVVFGLVVATVAPSAPFLPEVVRVKLAVLAEVVSNWGRRPICMAGTALASATIWGFGGFVIWLLVHALGSQLEFGFALAAFPLGVLAGLMPVTFSGIGTRDVAFVAILSTRIPVETATVAALGYTAITYWFLSAVSVPFVFGDLVASVRSLMGRSATKKASPRVHA